MPVQTRRERDHNELSYLTEKRAALARLCFELEEDIQGYTDIELSDTAQAVLRRRLDTLAHVSVLIPEEDSSQRQECKFAYLEVQKLLEGPSTIRRVLAEKQKELQDTDRKIERLAGDK